MRIESCTEGRSQTAAHLINEYRRGLFPFWEDVLGGFFVYRAAILDRFFCEGDELRDGAQLSPQ